MSPADANVILAGASTGGIWRSADGGANFVPVSDSQVDLAVGSLVFSKSSPNIVYAGMGDMQGCCTYMGSGILKSTDAGQTWTRVNNSSLPQPGAVGALAVDPNNPNRIYAALYRLLDMSNNASFPFGGFYLSTDGGVNWTNTFVGLPRDVVISPANPQTIYVAMRGVGASGNGGTGGVFRSTDGGNTWNIIYTSAFPPAFGASGGLRDIRVAVSAANPQKIYVYSGSTTSIRVDVSTDGGTNWTNLGNPGLDSAQFGYNTYLYVDPTNADIVYVGTRDVFKSTDAGSTWTNLTKSNISYSVALAHPDQHSLAFSSANSNVIYIGNDGGVYKSPDGGSSFQSLNATLSLTQFVSIARHPTDPAITYGGTQDNGTQKRTNVIPTQWRDFTGGDGGHCVVNPLDPTIVFATYVHGRIWRYNNNGDTFGGTIATDSTFKDTSGTNERTAFYPPFVGNGVNAQIYFGSQRVWTSTDLGATWMPTGTTADLTQGGTDVLNAISVARSDTNVIYTGSAQGRAMVSTDGGQNWTDATAGLPNRTITWFAIDNANPSNAYVSVSGFGSGHVFKTTNRGQSWTDVSGNLPNIPTNALLIDPSDQNIVYAGTDVGVFRSTTGGTNWSTFNDGLPPVVVMGFATNNSGQIQIATYGRGAYQMIGTQRFSISGRVGDGYGNGIAGATVTLSGTQAGTTTTDGIGNYSFSDLPAGGNYGLSPSKAGQYVAFARTVNNLSSNMTGLDLSLVPEVRATVHVADANGANFGGVAIKINDDPSFLWAPTNSFGNVNLGISVPAVGSVSITLTPLKLGYAFSPPSFTFNSQSGNQNATFAAIPPNAMDDARTFVTQQYRDFLNRDPDQSGLDYWTSQITNCGTDALCIHHKRIDVSNAFFYEQEFQSTGAYAYRLYRAAYGNAQPLPNPFPDSQYPGEELKMPNYAAFAQDRAQVIGGSNLAQNQLALANAFVQRPEFNNKYAANLPLDQFVDAVLATIKNDLGVDLTSQRNTLIGLGSRGPVMYHLADDNLQANPINNRLFIDAEYNRGFVYTQYAGYLRRDSDIRGFVFWLGQVSSGPLRDVTKQHAMVCSFITSAEYQLRFGSSVTRTNRDCSQ